VDAWALCRSMNFFLGKLLWDRVNGCRFCYDSRLYDVGCLELVAGVALSAFVAQGSNSGVALLSTKSQRSFRDV
jgi:hypothetical protein